MPPKVWWLWLIIEMGYSEGQKPQTSPQRPSSYLALKHQGPPSRHTKQAYNQSPKTDERPFLSTPFTPVSKHVKKIPS